MESKIIKFNADGTFTKYPSVNDLPEVISLKKEKAELLQRIKGYEADMKGMEQILKDKEKENKIEILNSGIHVFVACI